MLSGCQCLVCKPYLYKYGWSLVIWPKIKCVLVIWPNVRRYYKLRSHTTNRPGTRC